MRRLLVFTGCGGLAMVALGVLQLLIMAALGTFAALPWIIYPLFIIGTGAVGAMLDMGENPMHRHDWGRWEEWGIVYQQRQCRTCGKAQRKHP